MELNSIALAFLFTNSVILLAAPRRWAPLPLLIGACYMTLAQGIQLGPFNFPIIRILVAVGFIRTIIRRERIAGRMNNLDWLMIIWAFVALFSSKGHSDFSGALIFRFGLVYNACGIYFLFRTFCQSFDDIVRLCYITAIVLVPVATEMLAEKITSHNLFSVFGGVPETTVIRDGKLRAQGPFMHSILAGTIGAVCLPFMIGLWKQHQKTAIVGIVSCLTMVFTSSSSGPILSAVAAIGALFMWRWRHRMRLIRWLAVLGYIGLDMIMLAPAYYLIGRMDLTGSSTGYHRAELINQAFKHLNEWWLWGTDYTRHWMPTGVSWSPDHTDITNYYLHLGVVGGLPLMLLFIFILAKGFSYVGKTIKDIECKNEGTQFFLWTIGASLFAHAATGISVSYFDQSFLFIYMTVAIIGSAGANMSSSIANLTK